MSMAKHTVHINRTDDRDIVRTMDACHTMCLTNDRTILRVPMLFFF